MTLHLPHCTIDLDAQVVRRGEDDIPLRRQEVALLRFLTERPGALVTRRTLLVDVWGYHEHTHTRAIDITVARVRKKVEPDPRLPQHLLSVRGQGYRWFTTREEPEDPPQEPEPSRPPRPRTNLTPSLSTFIGRLDERARLTQLLGQAARLVTIHGPGGVGKTRLAREFGASQVAHHAGGVWFCDLSTARDLDGMVGALATVLGVSLGQADPVAQLGRALAGHRDLLVILDNFEQLVDPARGAIDAWRQAAPSARFLVTSRTRLGLQGEHVLPLGPLSPEEAVTLFVDRARAVRPTFTLTSENRPIIASVVQDLDGLSLAIELAAARVRVLTAAQIQDRIARRFQLLRGQTGARPDRHATLHSAIDWSWNLLSAEAQAILSQCRVFRGGFSLEAAEAVLAPQSPTTDILTVVESLCDQSVLHVVEPEPDQVRFVMLESIRAYLHTLPTTPASETALRTRHARHFASLWDPTKALHGAPSALRRYGALLSLEFDNLYEAVTGAIAAGDGDAAAAAALGVHAVCRASGRFSLALDAIQQVLGLSELRDLNRIHLHREAAWTLRRLGRDTEALEHVDAGIRLATTPETHLVRCTLDNDRGYLLFRFGRLDEAKAQYARALEQSRAGGHRNAIGMVLGNMGILFDNQGDMAEALRHYELAVVELRAASAWRAVAHTLVNQSILHAHAGRADPARRCLEEARTLQRDTGSQVNEANVLSFMGGLEVELGDPVRGRAYFEEAAQIHEKLGNQRSYGVAIGSLGDLDLREGRYREARDRLEQAVASCAHTWPVGAAAFRGGLGWALMGLGSVDAGRALLEAGEQGIRDKHVIGHAKLLRDWATAELDHGDRAQAARRLAEATARAAPLDLTEDSGLVRSLRALAARLAGSD